MSSYEIPTADIISQKLLSMDTSDVKDKQENLKDEKETVKDTLGDITTHVSEFVNTFYKLQVLKAAKKATDVSANVLGVIVSAVLGLFVLMFAGIALAFWIGDLIGSRAGGFAIMAGFFALVAVIFMLVRKQVVFPIWRNKIVKKFYE